eukprot:5609824-Prorocentrum_lima.AAC.1
MKVLMFRWEEPMIQHLQQTGRRDMGKFMSDTTCYQCSPEAERRHQHIPPCHTLVRHVALAPN